MPSAPVLTLPEALELAERHHPSLLSAAQRVLASEARRRDAPRLPNPEMEAEVENWGGSLGSDRRESAVRLLQTFELGGDRGARRGRASAEVDLAKADLEANRREVRREATRRFLDAWVLQEQVGRFREAERAAGEAVAAAEERLRAGAAPAFERVRFEGLHALRSVERRRAEAELAVARRGLALLWGANGAGFDSLALEEPDLQDPPSPESLALRLPTHPDRRRAALETALEDWRAREARAARVPDVTVGVGARHLAEADGSGFTVGVSFPLPLWSRNAGAVEGAEAERRAAAERERLVALRLRQDLTAAHERYRAAASSWLEMRDRVLPAAESALELIATAYRSGRFSYLDILEGQRGSLEANLLLIEATASVWGARADLEAILGRSLESPGSEGE